MSGAPKIAWLAITDQPDAPWVAQQARNTVWKLADGGATARYLIHDHDGKFAASADAVFSAEGISLIKTPIAAPRANAHIERQIGSTRRECLDWVLILDRPHLERVLAQWAEHYNQERPHQGLGLQTPIVRSDPVPMSRAVSCQERLGGLLRSYSRVPALFPA